MAIILDGSSGIVATGNVTANTFIGNISLGSNPVVTTGNVTGGNLITTGNVNATGNISASFFIGNGSQLTGIDATAIQNGTANVRTFLDANVAVSAAGSANVLVVTGTGANVTGTLNATGNANVGNLGTAGLITATGNIASSGNISAGYFIGNGSQLTGIDATAIQNGTANVRTFLNGNVTVSASGTANVLIVTGTGANIAGTLNATGNANVGNLGTAGLIVATGNVTGGNLVTAGQVSATGNVSGGNLNITGNIVDTGALFLITGGSGNVTLAPNGSNVVIATTTGANITGTLNATGNANVGNLGTAGLIVATGNVTGGNLVTGGKVDATGNITATANIAGGNITTAGIVTATGNVTGGNLVTAGQVSATGNVSSGNLNITGNIVDTGALFLITGGSGNVTLAPNGSNVVIATTTGANITGTLNATGNANVGNLGTAGLIVATGNVTGGNITTAGVVTATGNVTGGNVVAGANVVAGNLTTTGVLSVTGTGVSSIAGNLDMTSNNIINLAAPVNSTDAATKQYVDDLASTALIYHEGVAAATTGTLASATGGTITYNNGTSGVGATLTTTGTFNLIDTANVQTIGTRILVKNEANAAHNGVYTYTSTTVITRATDADSYGPGAGELSLNNYFFVSGGDVNKGSAYVVDSPSGTITFGTSNITFAQFSSSQVYLAGTGLALTNLTFSIANTAVTASSYGGSDRVASFTVNAQGQLTAAGNVVIGANAANLTGTTLNSGVVTSSLTSVGTLGSLTVSGNANVGNLGTAGLVVATGNVTGGNLVTAGQVSATGNVSGGNLNVTGNIVDTGALFLITGGSGNVTLAPNGSNVVVATTTGANVTGTLNATGNANVGNLGTAGLIVATGNVTGGNLVTAGQLSVTGNANVGNLGTAGLVVATGNVTGGNLVTAGQLSATGNVSGGNLNVTGNIVDTGALSIITGGSGNVALAPNGSNTLVATTTGVVLTGTLTFASGGNVSAGNILNTNSNGVGNIGNSTTYFNTVFAKATSAQYADIAEMYVADAYYEPGTVLSFGGTHEVTGSTVACDARIAGVVSTNPSYLMNSTLSGEHVAAVALMGRVETFVLGPVAKGDMMVSAGNGMAMSCSAPQMGTVIGKALEDFTGTVGKIELVVGRL